MTAVQWLVEQLEERGHIIPDHIEETSLKMEKQQMCDFFREGYMWCNSPSLHMENGKVITSTVRYGELYYERTYGSKGSDETKTN